MIVFYNIFWYTWLIIPLFNIFHFISKTEYFIISYELFKK